MPKIYKVQYTAERKKFFEGIDGIDFSPYWTFEYSYKSQEVIETKEVPYKIYFKSSYAGILDFEYIGTDKEWHRFSYMAHKEEFRNANGKPRFNYPDDETFEREYNGRIGQAWALAGKPVPDDVFEVFKLMYPDAVNASKQTKE